MSGWTKLFSSIVTSSIWVADDPTLRIWIAMLATADANGVVEGSVPGFANLARVTVEEMRAAVAILTAPDPDSRTSDHEGRRIEAIAGGWRLLNYRAYRDREQDQPGSRAPYYREYRRRVAQRPQHVAQQKTVARNTEERGEMKEERESTARGAHPVRALSSRERARKTPPAHAYAGRRLSVPRPLHEDFLRRRKGDEAGLLAWYADVDARWHGSPDEPGADMFDLWKREYAARWPATTTRRPPKPKYSDADLGIVR